MAVICLDLETYYDKEYSLKKMSTEAYIRDERFEVIGVSACVDDEEPRWFSGTHAEIKVWLQRLTDWSTAALVAHNVVFDGSILAWRFGITPRIYFDTLSMARGVWGPNVPNSLAEVAKRLNLPPKGNEILNALGKRRADFTPSELAAYGSYCVHDTWLSREILRALIPTFPREELRTIDNTVRMAVEPILELDADLLQGHLVAVRQRKEELLQSVMDRFKLNDPTMFKKAIMSNKKFAQMLESLGVEVPMKTSLTTGKPTYAFAKTDEGFQQLQEHEDLRVQTLATARLGLKSTLEETRTEAFLQIASRGLMPVPLTYCGAHTHRFSGTGGGINVQNLPSRDKNKKALKQSICAPPGYVIINSDLAQIEARVLAWFAGQMDLVNAFARGEDVYKKMAGSIYGVSPDEVTDEQRFYGKTCVLSAGYGVGAVKFKDAMRSFGKIITLEEAQTIVGLYRENVPFITQLWRNAHNLLGAMVRGEEFQLGPEGVIVPDGRSKTILFPSGLRMHYRGLKAVEEEKGLQYYYLGKRGVWTKIYGGRLVENIIQCLARCVIVEHMNKIAKRYRVVMTVHDSIVCCVREEEAEDAARFIQQVMRTAPSWAKNLPVNCDIEIGPNYGDTKKWPFKKD